jgi:hypothetical protein
MSRVDFGFKSCCFGSNAPNADWLDWALCVLPQADLRCQRRLI